MDRDAPGRDEHVEDLGKRVEQMDLSTLAQRLAALDQEQGRPDSAPDGDDARLDTASLTRILAELGPLAAAADAHTQQSVQAAVGDRERALHDLLEVIRLKLAARGEPEIIAQGLRRVEEAVYRQRSFITPDPGICATDPLRVVPALLDEFDSQLAIAQAAARDLLKSELGLEMMPDQTGKRVDPSYHDVGASHSGDDPARENTVSSQESPGWLLEGAVIVAADVVRYTCSSGGAPLLPDLDDVRNLRVDDDLFGQKRKRD